MQCGEWHCRACSGKEEDCMEGGTNHYFVMVGYSRRLQEEVMSLKGSGR